MEDASRCTIWKKTQKHRVSILIFLNCSYHSGKAVFHDRAKYWSCCPDKKAWEFDDFLKLKGCCIGPHDDGNGPLEEWDLDNFVVSLKTNKLALAGCQVTKSFILDLYLLLTKQGIYFSFLVKKFRICSQHSINKWNSEFVNYLKNKINYFFQYNLYNQLTNCKKK